MSILAHAADLVVVAPVVVIVAWISIKALLERRRELKKAEREEG
jgi:hypothetical protein